MGWLFGQNKTAATTTDKPKADPFAAPTTTAPTVRRMSDPNSSNIIEAGRLKRQQIAGRSGRESTRLAPASAGAGSRPFVNTFLGSVQ